MKPLEVMNVLERFDFHCALTDSHEIHIEHWIPVSKGGETSIRNCYPLDTELNLKKGNRNPFVFFEREDIVDKFEKERFDSLVFWLAVINNMSVDEFRKHTFTMYDKGNREF